MVALKYRDPDTDTWIYIPTAGPGRRGRRRDGRREGDPGEPGGRCSLRSGRTTRRRPPHPNGQCRTNSRDHHAVDQRDRHRRDGPGRRARHRRSRRHDHRAGRQRHGDGPADHRHPDRLGHLLDDPGVGHHRHRDQGARTQIGILSPTPHGIPAGGTTDQVLAKTSGTDYAVGWTTLTKTAVGLGNVDNTTDAAKPVSTATQTALDLKSPPPPRRPRTPRSAAR